MDQTPDHWAPSSLARKLDHETFDESRFSTPVGSKVCTSFKAFSKDSVSKGGVRDAAICSKAPPAVRSPVDDQRRGVGRIAVFTPSG